MGQVHPNPALPLTSRITLDRSVPLPEPPVLNFMRPISTFPEASGEANMRSWMWLCLLCRVTQSSNGTLPQLPYLFSYTLGNGHVFPAPDASQLLPFLPLLHAQAGGMGTPPAVFWLCLHLPEAILRNVNCSTLNCSTLAPSHFPSLLRLLADNSSQSETMLLALPVFLPP